MLYLLEITTKGNNYIASDKNYSNLRNMYALSRARRIIIKVPCLRFSSYSPAFFVQNKIRLKDVKRRVNKVQTHGDRPNHMSSGYSKELNVQNVRYFMNFQVVQRRDTT